MSCFIFNLKNPINVPNIYKVEKVGCDEACDDQLSSMDTLCCVENCGVGQNGNDNTYHELSNAHLICASICNKFLHISSAIKMSRVCLVSLT